MTTDAMQNTWEEAVLWLREQPGSESVIRDAYFDDPLLAAAQRYSQSNEWQAVRKMIGEGPGQALDVGAGRGIASYALARDGFEVTALEPNPSKLVGTGAIQALSREARLRIRIVEDASERLPFADGSFDVIFARAVLHHIANLSAAMLEFHRVLRPGGIFVAIREHVISSQADLPAFYSSHALHHRYGGENAYPLAFYQDTIKGSGLVLMRTIGSLESPVNYGPQSTSEVHLRIASRLMPLSPGRDVIAALLRIPGVGGLVRLIASRLDRRPGRHVSFVARRMP